MPEASGARWPFIRIDERAVPGPSLGRQAILPVTFVLACALYFLAHVPPFGAMCVMATGLVLHTWAPLLANGARDAYDREVLPLLMKGADLSARLDRAWLFRAFGPPAEVATRRANALAVAGKLREAADAWRVAIAGYPNGMPRAVALGFAHGAFEAGRDGEAVTAYRVLLEKEVPLPLVKVRLAHALARLSESLDEADTLLTAAEAGAEASSPETIVARAAWLSASGKKKEARARLERLAKIPPHLEAEVKTLSAPAKKVSAS